MFFPRQKLDFKSYCFFKIFFQVSFLTVFIFVATVIFTQIAKFDRLMNMFILTKIGVEQLLVSKKIYIKYRK